MAVRSTAMSARHRELAVCFRTETHIAHHGDRPAHAEHRVGRHTTSRPYDESSAILGTLTTDTHSIVSFDRRRPSPMCFSGRPIATCCSASNSRAGCWPRSGNPLRFQVSAACADQNLIVVVPWARAVISGSPVVRALRGVSEGSSATATTIGSMCRPASTGHQTPEGRPIRASPTRYWTGRTRTAATAAARTGFMDTFIHKVNHVLLCGIKTTYWQAELSYRCRRKGGAAALPSGRSVAARRRIPASRSHSDHCWPAGTPAAVSDGSQADLTRPVRQLRLFCGRDDRSLGTTPNRQKRIAASTPQNGGSLT